MRKTTMQRFAALCVALLVVLVASTMGSHGAQSELSRDHHRDKLMARMESSLAKLNDTLHDWKDRGMANSHLGAVAARSADVITKLDDLVDAGPSTNAAVAVALQRRRRLSQIYDEASKQAAEERLASVTAEAEARYADAIVLLQDAATKAIQNNTEDLMARMAEKLRNNNVVSTGKIISDQLQALQLADQVTEIARGLVPEFNPGAGKELGNGLFDGTLLDRLRPKKEAEKGAGTAAAAEEEVSVDVVVVSADGELPPEPVKVSPNATATPSVPFDPTIGEEVTRADFYREAGEVFDRFDGEGTTTSGDQAVTMRRRALRSSLSTSSINVDALIQKVESSLDALKSMHERGVAVSEETAAAIRSRALDVRQRLQDMNFAHGRRHLSQDDSIIDGDAPDSQSEDTEEVLIFPGETLESLHSRIASDPDGIIDAPEPDASASDDELLTMLMMPAIPMVMSQEINFVFVPVADTTDAEELIQSVADVVMSTIAEASMSMFMGFDMGEELDLGMFGAYDDTYELPEGKAPHGFGALQLDTSSSYREPRSATAKRRRRLQASHQSVQSMDMASVNDSYELELYFYDPAWFNSAQASEMLVQDDDGLAELSLAIRLSGPEDMGGLPPDVLLFIAESEMIMDAMASAMAMPSYSVFDAGANKVIAQAQNSENLADTIVNNLQSTYGAYGQPARTHGLYSTDPRGYQSSDFDLRWLGVMFGAVGIVLIVAIGFITAFQNQRGAQVPRGYVVIEDVQSVQPSKVITAAKPAANRKTSNLPA